MSTTHRLRTPLDAATVRHLALGDLVYLDGEIVLAAGIPTHERLCAHVTAPESLPIDLRGAVMLHFGSYSHERGGRFALEYLNPTTSTRFGAWVPRIVETWGLRAVGGKGGLDARSAAAMQRVGCVYLSFPGGLCTLYSAAIREVVAVEWSDLIFQYRLVKLRVEGLGPASVAIDAHGHNRYDELSERAAARLPGILERLAADRTE